MCMVEDCESRESRLNDWEQGFIQSIREWIEDERPLTDTQLRKLENIWERATRNG